MPLFSFLQNNPVKKEYDISNQVLGKGSFGVVKLATQKGTGKQVAVKAVKKELLNRRELFKLGQEIEIMKKVDHPNCIKFHDMFDTSNKMYIVLELVTGGELFDRVIAKAHYSETEAAGCFVQLITAIAYLHSIGIVHRDIKPENILYESPAENSRIKLSDFGLAKRLNQDTDKTMTTACGSWAYVAPEVIGRDGYGKECDVWSAGVILYILLSGMPPWEIDLPTGQLFALIRNQRYSFDDAMWQHISHEAKDVISGMMRADVSSRLTPHGVLAHPWVRRYYKADLPTTQMPAMQQRLKEWKAASRRFKGAIGSLAALMRMSADSLPAMPSPAQQKEMLAKVRSDERWMGVLREAFSMLDRDATGTLDVQNIADTMRSLDAAKSPEELQRMVQRFDVRKTGAIDFDEFCIMMGPAYYTRAGGGEEELARLFQTIDVHRTGTINQSELKDVMGRLGQQMTDAEVNDMVCQADKNSDGVIDYDEFKSFLMRTAS